MQKRKLGRSNLEVSALGLGCMGMSFGSVRRRTGSRASRSFTQPSSAASRSSTPPKCMDRSRTRNWSVKRSRPSRERLRSPPSSAFVSTRTASRSVSTAGPSTSGGGRSLAEAAQGRGDRLVLSASRRSGRADRGRRRDGEGTDSRRQGEALRSFRSRCADDPSRPRGAAGHGAAERVLAVVAGARAGNPADARGTGHRLRSVQPAGQGISDGQDRREHAVRQIRLPQRRAAIHAGSPQGQSGAGRGAGKTGGPKEGDAGTARARVAAGAEAVDRADPRDDQAASARGEPWRADVELTSADLHEIESATAQTPVQGARYPEHMQKLVDR